MLLALVLFTVAITVVLTVAGQFAWGMTLFLIAILVVGLIHFTIREQKNELAMEQTDSEDSDVLLQDAT